MPNPYSFAVSASFLIALTLPTQTPRTDRSLIREVSGYRQFRSKGKRVRLFDGKSFDGWEGDTKGTWRIQNGALVGGSLTEIVPHNAFLAHQRVFGDFELRLKFKLVGTGFTNGGVQFRSQRIKDPEYEMTGYQADMGEGYWGCLYDESRRNTVLMQAPAELIKKILKPNDWNDYRIRAEGSRIRLWLNRKLTVDYVETDPSIAAAGLIAVQIHGGGKAEASYKDIFIEELQ